MRRILVIDDDAASRDAIRAALDGRYEMIEAGGGEDGIAQFDAQRPDLVICDVVMPEIDGLAAVRYFRRRDPRIPVIVVSGGGRIGAADYLRIAAAFGAQKCLAKPLRVRELQDTVAALLVPDQS